MNVAAASEAPGSAVDIRLLTSASAAVCAIAAEPADVFMVAPRPVAPSRVATLYAAVDESTVCTNVAGNGPVERVICAREPRNERPKFAVAGPVNIASSGTPLAA